MHLADWVSKALRVQPEFICGPRVTENVLRGRKRFSTAVVKVNFDREGFVREGSWRDFCLNGGCRSCPVRKRKRVYWFYDG